MKKYNFSKCLECHHDLVKHVIINNNGIFTIECIEEPNREYCGCNGGFTQKFKVEINKSDIS